MSHSTTLKEVCKSLGIGWRELAQLTGESPDTMRKRYHAGHAPRSLDTADRIIQVLLRRNRAVKAVEPAVIRKLWRAA